MTRDRRIEIANLPTSARRTERTRTNALASERLIKIVRGACLATICMACSACGTAPPGEGLLDKTLSLVGLQVAAPAGVTPVSSEMVQAITASTKIPMRIHASDQLNSGTSTRPLSLVLKIYKLKGYEDFMRSPYATFAQGAYTHEDVISSREVVLLPGQRLEVEETLPKGTKYLAIVAMFKSPDDQRWRFVFDVNRSAKQGVTLGAHQCALSVSQGETVESPTETRRLAGSLCR